MSTSLHDYQVNGETYEAYVASPSGDGKKPAVLICHAWAGQLDFEQERARDIAALGYVGIALDVYGKGVRGDPSADNSHLMMPLKNDRAKLRELLLGGLKFAQSLDNVDTSKIAIMGYCFGGLCAIDLARTGTDEIKAACSFHGLFDAPNLGEQKPISAKVVAFHGYSDPMATPQNLVDFGTEMNAAGCDWQVHAYGGVYHAFTNPHANAPQNGMQFNAAANKRSWNALKFTLSEVF